MAQKRKKTPEKLQIAIDRKSGEWVSIYEVPTGRACNCIFPDSDGDIELDAKNKNKHPNTHLRPGQKIAHFAVAKGQEYEGEPHPETAIHKLAKEVFKDTKCISIPELICEEGLLKESMKIEFDNVVIEDTSLLSEFGFKPDAVGKKESKNGILKKLLIEFKKTHAVEENKIVKIQRCKISCIEIDLCGIAQLDKAFKPNRQGIKARLLDSKFSIWIYNAEEESLRKMLIEKLRQEELDRQKEEAEFIKNSNNKSEENLDSQGKQEVVDYYKWKKDLDGALLERLQRTKGLNRARILEIIEHEKVQLPLEQVPKFCKIIEVKQYIDCPISRGYQNNCTLLSCFNCRFFYKIKTVPKSSCDFVICGFRINRYK